MNMKTIQKILMTLAVLAVFCVFLPNISQQVAAATVVDSGSCGDNVTYTLYDDGELVISGTGNMRNYFYNRHASWYDNRSSIKKVTIESGVTSIGDYAFYFCRLTSVTIPNSVTSIGDHAFCGCDGLTSIIIPNSVTSIGKSAFYYCDRLTSVTIPDSVTSIGEEAFCECKSLTSVNIPNSVTSIGEEAFENTGIYNNKNNWIDGVLYIDHCLIKANSSDLPAEYQVKKGTSVIADSAFYDCGELTSVTIPDSVASIGNSAFWKCSGLTSITIPDSVTSIGDYTFGSCSGLTSVTIGNSVSSIGEKAFYGCSGLTSVTIPDSVTSIGVQAFDSCDSVTEVYYTGTAEQWLHLLIGFGNTPLTNLTVQCSDGNAEELIQLASCGDNVYFKLTKSGRLIINGSGAMRDYPGTYRAPWDDNKSSIQEVIIKPGVTSVGTSAFGSCSGLTSVTIPDSVTSIGDAAFYGCGGLPSITIPDSVTSIGDSAFSKCDGLTSVTIGNSVTSIGDSAFNSCSGLTSVTIGDSVTSIGNSAFAKCDGLTSVTIGNSVISIGDSAFAYCRGVKSITIPDSVTSIGNSAFTYCSGLTSVTIPDSVTSVGTSAFAQCDGLTSVTIGNSVTSIGNSAFAYCSGLTSVTIGNSVTSIGNSAFAYCSGLTSVTIGNSVSSIGNYAFWIIYRLFDVYYLGTQEEWKAIAVGTNNGSLINADIHCLDGAIRTIADTGACGENLIYTRYASGVLEISGNGAMTDYSYASPSPWYDNRDSVKKIIIKPGVTQIGECAFKNCIATSVTIPNSVLQIGESAFENCSGLTSITIPDSVTQIGESAFEACTKLTSVTIPDSVTSIGNSAFKNCTNLTSVTIPDGVTQIEKAAFEYCRGLESITIPYTVTHIGEYAFYECSELKEVHITDVTAWCKIQFGDGYSNPLYYAKNLYINGELATDIVIPDDVFSISNYAFYNYASLTSVMIPDSVISIGDEAFRNCAHLTEISIPDSVTLIGSNAFTGCTNMQNIQVDAASKKYSSKDGVLFNKDGSTLITYPAGRTGEYTIPAGVKNIAKDAFYSVKGVTSLVMPEGVTSVGNDAFNRCIGLTSVTLPASVESIGYNAFENCDGITDVYYNGTARQWQTIYFGSNNEALTTATIHCADGAYINGGNCGSYLKWLMYDDGRLVIYKGYDHGSGDMTDWDTPDTVPWREYRDKIKSITIEESVTSVGSCAFYGCANVTEILVPSGVTRIGTNAFDSCAGLKRVTLPLSVTEIENRAFRKCDAVSEVIYLGTAEQWSGVTIGTSGNECLTGVQFRPNNYVITYNYAANGGTSAGKQSATAAQGAAIDLSVAAVKNGWAFLGWNTDENATTALTAYTATKNSTLYAIFKKDITVRFLSEQGETISTESVTIYNKALNATVSMPYGSGSDFVGWAMGSLDGKVYSAYSNVTVTDDTVMYATYAGEAGYPVRVSAKVEYVDGKYRVTVTVNGQAEGMTIRAVAYNSANRPLGTQDVDVTGGTVVFDNLYYCKVFVWDENMQPLANPVKVYR